MGAILIQLIPHEFKEIDDKDKRHQFLVETSTILSKRLNKTVCVREFDDYFDYGSLGAIDIDIKGTYETVHLCRDYWRVDYPFHYAQIVINYDGVLIARNRCYQLAQILGSHYSHYCNEYFYEPYMEKDCSLESILSEARPNTQIYPAEYFRNHPWSEVMWHYNNHYDDNYEDIIISKHSEYDSSTKMKKV